jgi:hypothetical protein
MADDLKRVQDMYRAAVALRKDADPLLAGQYEGLIGRLTALLAAMGAAIPDDALPRSGKGD